MLGPAKGDPDRYTALQMNADSRPLLRPVESIVVTDRERGRVLVLRDTQGITSHQAVIPVALAPIVAHFYGALTCREIAREASTELGAEVAVDLVVDLARKLEESLFLEGPVLRAARANIEREFAESAIRPASHAGGAYYGEKRALERYIDEDCLARASQALPTDGASRPTAAASAQRPAPTGQGRRMVGLVAPHIDPWRGAIGYGRAYSALAAALPDQVDTFVLLGTSHAPMRAPFALCRKAFETPLGVAAPDLPAIDRLAARADGFDPYADQFNHKREHSLEFQVVFLKHLMKEKPFRIVPILAGLGAFQGSGADPANDIAVSRFVDGLRELVENRAGRVVLVGGADLAHVGPRFGDPAGYNETQRRTLERADRASLDLATSLDAAAFWFDVVGDANARRVCGLAPIWSLINALSRSGAEGHTLHYEQTIDRDDGSIVSHAAVGYYV